MMKIHHFIYVVSQARWRGTMSARDRAILTLKPEKDGK